MNLTFITGNAGKAKYLSDYFHAPIEHRKLDLAEIQSLNLREVVEDKAKRAFAIVGSPVLVEDVSLSFSSLNGLPGPLIKWFLEALGNEGICRVLDMGSDRNALAEVMFAICDEKGVTVFHAEKKGTIARGPKGESGFGWDPIFIPEGHTKTWAEMSDNEKHETSMRREALEKLSQYLQADRETEG